MEHTEGSILPQVAGSTQYKKLKTNEFTLRLDKKDSCVMIAGTICIINNQVKLKNEISIIFQRFTQEEDFFNLPLPSRSLGIREISALGNTFHITKIENIEAK